MHLCLIVLCLDVVESGIGWQHTTGTFGNQRCPGDCPHLLSLCCETAQDILLGSERACVEKESVEKGGPEKRRAKRKKRSTTPRAPMRTALGQPPQSRPTFRRRGPRQ